MNLIPSSILALAGQGPQLETRLEAWAGINSASSNRPGLRRMAETLLAAVRELTPEAEIIPLDGTGRVAIVARCRPEARRRFLCSGHFDTVHAPDSPFQSCSRPAPGVLRGPGVADMKGGLVVLLAALAALEQTPEARHFGWELLLTPDEETGSVASQPWLQAAAARADFGLIFEAAREGGELVRSRKGSGRFTLTCHGESAHAARARDHGRNAILALADALLRLQAAAAAEPAWVLNVATIQGGREVNVVPDLATADVNLRIDSAAQGAAFRALLARLAEETQQRTGCALTVQGGIDRPPLEPSLVGDHLLQLWNESAGWLGRGPPGAVHAAGGSDANLLQAAGLPCLDGLGPVGGQLHSDQEYIVTSSLTERAQLTALSVWRWARQTPA